MENKFEAFCWYHLLHYLIHPIEDFHRELIGLIKYPRVAIAAPRSFAKSSYFSLFYPLFKVLEQPGVQILLVSATGALAEHWLAKIRKELESNKTIIEFYGAQEGKKWATDEIHLNNGSVIMAKGAGKQIRGFRPDIAIGDDLETDEMVVSADQRKKFDHWFWTDLLGTLKAECQLIIVGTLLHPESFLADLVHKGRHGWETRFYQAIKTNGEALWPREWDLVKLDNRRREMGDYEFAQEYMNDPLPDDLRKFQRGWFKYFKDPPKNLTYFTTVDPAIEVGNANDYTAIVTCGIDPDMNMYVVEVINKRLLPKETIDAIFDVYGRWEPAVIGIESIGFQKMLKFEVEQERNRRRVWPIIVELKSGGRRKSLRIEALQPRFQNGKIFIKEDMQDLETQFLRFPSPRCHDDICDSLAFQLDIIRPSKHDVVSINPDSFIATIERRRRNNKFGSEFWGNHHIRGSNG